MALTRSGPTRGRVSPVVAMQFLMVGGSGSDGMAEIKKGNEMYSTGKMAEAIKWYNLAIKKNRYNETAWNNKGVVLRRLGRFEEAISHHDESLRINKRYPDAWCNKGIALTKMGRNEEAMQAFDSALRLNPSAVCVKSCMTEKTAY